MLGETKLPHVQFTQSNWPPPDDAKDTGILWEAVAVLEAESVTVRVAEKVDAVEYAWVEVCPDPVEPSPKSQE